MEQQKIDTLMALIGPNIPAERHYEIIETLKNVPDENTPCLRRYLSKIPRPSRLYPYSWAAGVSTGLCWAISAWGCLNCLRAAYAA